MKIIVFGEDLNDILAVKELVLWLRPELLPADVRIIRDPPTLVRGTGNRAVRTWAEKALSAIKATKAVLDEVECVLAHSDADGPDGIAFQQSRSEQLQHAGLETAIAVVPVQSIESWWLLFPTATETVVPGWRGALPRHAYTTDGVNRPKQDLMERTRRKLPRRPYQEADSPSIARAIAAGRSYGSEKPSSPSFVRFAKDLDAVLGATS